MPLRFGGNKAREVGRVTLTIELSDREQQALAATARRQGLAVEAAARALVVQGLAGASPEASDPTILLLDRWAEEDGAAGREQLAIEDAMWAEFERDINAQRRAAGMRLL